VSLYRELHRPQFHFTARENWLNDPNGLVYYEGVWHLFFQHNAEAPTWGRMWWGHATSTDLIHWQQAEPALYPDESGSMFSGSAVVDHNNTAGFGEGALLIFYTAAGHHAEPPQAFRQCLAYSLDNGEHWQKYSANPIVEHLEAENRDPKVVWHEPSGQWIMALYLADDRFCLLRSRDARRWQRLQELSLPGAMECPDLFVLSDESGTERWVFSGGNGSYQIGQFDGEKFTAQTPVRHYELGRNGYAGQTWSNAPDGRCVQISWMAGGLYPEMPFNQQMSIPVELSLLGSGEDARLVRWPVQELAALRRDAQRVERQAISEGAPLLISSDAVTIDVTFTVYKQQARAFYLVVRGHPVYFDWSANTLSIKSSGEHKAVPARPEVDLPEGTCLSIRLLVDRSSIEVFINQGQLAASYCFLPDGYVYTLALHSYGGEQIIEALEMHELASIWGV